MRGEDEYDLNHGVIYDTVKFQLTRDVYFSAGGRFFFFGLQIISIRFFSRRILLKRLYYIIVFLVILYESDRSIYGTLYHILKVTAKGRVHKN